jgi:hypothetical protein
MFMCRWPNGDLSFVSAPTKEDAIIMLDEWDNAELAELSCIRDFMVDFKLNDDGELELQAFGESLLDGIWKKAYPVTMAPEKGAIMAVKKGPVVRLHSGLSRAQPGPL